MAKNSKATSAAKPAMARSTTAPAPRGARRRAGKFGGAPLPDRIKSTVTTFRDLNPFCSPATARGRPFAGHVHESVQTQLAALTHTLLASSAAQDQ
jgi:hypothetical protein